LNALEEKVQLRNEMNQKTNPIVFQLDRQEQYIRRENILIYGAEQNKEDNDDDEKVLFCPVPSHSNLCPSHPMGFPSHYYNINMEYNSIKIIRFLKV